MEKIRVLSLPSRHPYTSKFDRNGISFVNPNTDLFSWKQCSPDYLETNYPSETYDVVHIHFSFDKVSAVELEATLKYFKEKKKPIIWTLHSKESQRIRNYGEGKYQKLLFQYADKIICPTQGAKHWCEVTFGEHTREIDFIPLGFMSDPRDVERLQNEVDKDSKLFTMLVGEFRQNKEFIQSIVNFLQCSELKDFRLQLIYKPIPLLQNDGSVSNEMKFFYELTKDPRIINLSLPEISNDELNKAFLRSHAVIIAYKWGTHSGQIEQAKDCGCHAVASDVGFYKEQWEDVCLYHYSDNDSLETARNYTNALIEVSKRPSIKPMGVSRLEELDKSIEAHVRIYTELLKELK